VFEIRDTAGLRATCWCATPSSAYAREHAGDKVVVLMRGHGSVTVGTSIPHVFRAYMPR
jgi:hypothetical protein